MDHLNHLLAEYLGKTRQLSPLGLRQARMLAMRLPAEVQQGAYEILLAMLHWWERGAAGVGIAHLQEIVSRDRLQLMHGEFAEEWDDRWDSLKFPPLDLILRNPSRWEPLFSAHLEKHPLVVVDRERGLFSFQRAFSAVHRLEIALQGRLKGLDPETPETLACLQKTFAHTAQTFHFRQVAACALALRTRFMILSGGPGTGKTSVVIQILKTLMAFDPQLQQDRIMLCAPTGRAKARMGESVHAVFPLIPSATLHSLLGQRPDGSFRHHAKNVLPYQVVVVDEASMVDLHLFAGLLDALDANARLILIGDMHQLPSVEAGAVLGDLTEAFSVSPTQGCFSATCDTWMQKILREVPHSAPDGSSTRMALEADRVSAVGALIDHTVILNHTYRSVAGIRILCQHINTGNSNAVEEAMLSPEVQQHVCWQDRLQVAQPILFVEEWWKKNVALESLEALRGIDPMEPESAPLLKIAFDGMLKNRVLVLSHQGDLGRIKLNELANRIFKQKLDPNRAGDYYHGQQVILGHNHHNLGLFNGDLGIMVQCRQGLRAVFKQGDSFLAVSMDMLIGLESAYAMTVHKSQGSEFDHVLFVLPERDTPLLNRQILYTGITRAKSKVEILGTKEILRRGVECRDIRPGGVRI